MSDRGSELSKTLLKTGLAVGISIAGANEALAAGPTPTPTKSPETHKVTPKATEAKPPTNIVKTAEPTLPQNKPSVTVETKWPTPTATNRPLTLEDDVNKLLMENRDNKAVNGLIMVKEWLAEHDSPFTRTIGGFVLLLITSIAGGKYLISKSRLNVENAEKAKKAKQVDTDKLRLERNKNKTPEDFSNQPKEF